MLSAYSHTLVVESFNFLVEPTEHDPLKPYFIYVYNDVAYHIG